MIIGLIDNDVCNDYCAWSKSPIFSARAHKITAMLPLNDGLQTGWKKSTRVELLNKNIRRSVGVFSFFISNTSPRLMLLDVINEEFPASLEDLFYAYDLFAVIYKSMVKTVCDDPSSNW